MLLPRLLPHCASSLAVAVSLVIAPAVSAAPASMVDWSSVFDANGTPLAETRTTTALIRDSLSFNRAIEGSIRKRVGNVYSAAQTRPGRLPRQHDIGNSYFHGETVAGSSIAHLATERLYRKGTTAPTNVRFLLTKARSGLRRDGDLTAQVRYARNGDPTLLVVHKFLNGKWRRVSFSRFNSDTGCAGNTRKAMACVERVRGAIVSSGPEPRDRDGAAVTIPPVNERVQLRLNLSGLDTKALACTHMSVFTPRDIAEGPVQCLPSSKPYRLRPVTDTAELERQIKDGLIENYGYVPYTYPEPNNDGGVDRPESNTPSSPTTSGGSSSSGSSGSTGGSGGSSGGAGASDGGNSGGGSADDVSGTNVQEIGVDEYDRVKTNGDHVFIMSNEYNYDDYSGGGSSGAVPFARTSIPYGPSTYDVNLKVVDINPGNATAATLTELNLADDSRLRGTGLYLYEEGNALIMTANQSGFNYWLDWYSPGSWNQRESEVIEIDISNPGAPSKNRSLNINGEVISSRRIGNTLYVASRSYPDIEGLEYFARDSAEAEVQIARIEAATLADLLPTYTTTSNATPRPLVAGTDCVIPATRGQRRASADIVTVAAIDLDTMDVRASRCFIGDSETLYMTTKSLYLATTRYDYAINNGVADYRDPEIKTDVHRFTLDNDLTYRASGAVPGHLGWNIERKPWRFSEDGDVLRVVTMTNEARRGGSPITLTMLKDTGSGRLDVIASLPNSARPEPLGKPGERLYASRFMGDRGYFVTFRMTDPLYVLDLSEPADPHVTGELEIDGYSDYLHPVSADLMLGIGKDAVPDPNGDVRGAWYQGVKLSLFDVSDPANPTEVDNVIIGKRGSESAALYTHKAFTFRPAKNGNPARLALAMSMADTVGRWTNVNVPSSHYDWTHSGAYLFEINEGNAPAIRSTGQMIVERAEEEFDYDSRNYTEDRTILADEAVYLIREQSVFGAKWDTPENWTGTE